MLKRVLKTARDGVLNCNKSTNRVHYIHSKVTQQLISIKIDIKS